MHCPFKACLPFPAWVHNNTTMNVAGKCCSVKKHQRHRSLLETNPCCDLGQSLNILPVHSLKHESICAWASRAFHSESWHSASSYPEGNLLSQLSKSSIRQICFPLFQTASYLFWSRYVLNKCSSQKHCIVIQTQVTWPAFDIIRWERGTLLPEALVTKVNVKSRALQHSFSVGPLLSRAHFNFYVRATCRDLSDSIRNRCWFLDSNLQGFRIYEYWYSYDIYLIVPGMVLISDYFSWSSIFENVFYISGSQTSMYSRIPWECLLKMKIHMLLSQRFWIKRSEMGSDISIDV